MENIFYSRNVRSALKLGHARGVALLAASESGLEVFEYTPAEVKRAVVGYGRAEKPQIQQMMKLLLGLDAVPSPHDAADALAVAVCHVNSSTGVIAERAAVARPSGRTGAPALRWRDYRPEGQDAWRAGPRPSAGRSGTRRRGAASAKK